jgi:hypothetical protein
MHCLLAAFNRITCAQPPVRKSALILWQRLDAEHWLIPSGTLPVRDIARTATSGKVRAYYAGDLLLVAEVISPAAAVSR